MVFFISLESYQSVDVKNGLDEWEYPFEGICVLDLFGGISTGLVVVFQVGIPVQKYLYVEKDETVRRVSSCHLTLLMRRYPELLPRSAI
jgi:hypothetical protein